MLNSDGLSKIAKEMQDEMVELNKNMHSFITHGKSHQGDITVTIDGFHHIKSISINNKNLDQNQLIKEIIEAVNDAIYKATIELDARVSVITHRYGTKAAK